MSVKYRCNTLTLKSKMGLIKCYEEEKISVKVLMEKFKCGKTQVYDILKNKDKIKTMWFTGEYSGQNKRKLRKTGNEDINDILYHWFLDARARNLPISGPILQEQAKIIAQRLEKNDFKASNGWLVSFKSRHEISYKTVCGEAKDVELDIVDEWKIKLKELIQDYAPRNVGNCDETGLFFKALPSKTLTYKNDKCVGGKQPKERLTVLLCGFADGTVEKLLVIGKSLKPRCFKNLNVQELPVTWRANKKAWMTSSLMEEWLKILNRKMQTQNRNILLFLDNAACHPHLEFSNIKLAFFPANTTSLTQPMDQGVIKNMKMHYRKILLQSLCANIDTCTSVTELSKKISVLDAIRWISSATNKITKECVKKCFKHAGFNFEENTGTEDMEDSGVAEEMQDIQLLIDNLPDGSSTTAENYLGIDEAVVTGGYETLDDLIRTSVAALENEEENGDEAEGQGLAMNIRENEKINTFSDATVMEENAPRVISKQLTLPEIWKNTA